MRRDRFIRWSLAPALSLAAAACGGKGEEGAAAPAAPRHVATIRGKVVALSSGGRTLVVHHERVDDFKNRDGVAEPMGEMTMSFPLADGVSAGDVKAGDEVSLRYSYRWTADPVDGDSLDERVEQVERLPPGTVRLTRSDG